MRWIFIWETGDICQSNSPPTEDDFTCVMSGILQIITVGEELLIDNEPIPQAVISEDGCHVSE